MANCASASERDLLMVASACFTRRRAANSCKVLASRIVQVTSDAKARLTITALTRMSADMNIDQGESSRGTRAFEGADCNSVGWAAGVGAAGAAACAAVIGGAGGSGVWAAAGAVATRASAISNAEQLRNIR